MSRLSEKTHGSDGVVTAGEMKRREQAFHDAQEITVRCELCPGWSYTGPAAEARAIAAEHRRDLVKRHAALGVGRSSKDAQIREAIERRRERDDEQRLATIERGRQRSALEAMDAGEPQKPGLEERDPEAEAHPLDERGFSAGRSDEPQGAASETPDGAGRSPSRSSNPDTKEEPMPDTTATGRPTTRETVIAAVEAFRAKHGRMPLPGDAKTDESLPHYGFHQKDWAAAAGFTSWQAVWDHFDAGKIPQGRGASNYRKGGTMGGATRPKQTRSQGPRTAQPPAAANGAQPTRTELILAAARAVDAAEAVLAQAKADLAATVQELV